MTWEERFWAAWYALIEMEKVIEGRGVKPNATFQMSKALVEIATREVRERMGGWKTHKGGRRG
jgi:hypothetical protein